MKIKCPKCKNLFSTRGIHISGNATNVTLFNNTIIEQCTHCGYAFDPQMNGVYNFNDGVPILIQELNSLGLPIEKKALLSTINYNNISNADILIESIKDIDYNLVDKIHEWLKRGILLSAIITTFMFFSKCNFSKGFDHAKTQIENSSLIPDSVKTSYLRSYLPNKNSLDSINPSNFKKK